MTEKTSGMCIIDYSCIWARVRGLIGCLLVRYELISNQWSTESREIDGGCYSDNCLSLVSRATVTKRLLPFIVSSYHVNVWELPATCVTVTCYLCVSCLLLVWQLPATCLTAACNLCDSGLSLVWQLPVTCIKSVRMQCKLNCKAILKHFCACIFGKYPSTSWCMRLILKVVFELVSAQTALKYNYLFLRPKSKTG